MKAAINRIIEFSNVDGPGNRLAIFFQACCFKCLYCHNPETIRLCDDCGVCIAVCPQGALSVEAGIVRHDEKACVRCDACILACEKLADPRVKNYELSEVLAIIKSNKDYIRGITVSGGEPLLYSDFVTALFKETQALGLSCMLDTNGNYDFSSLQELLSYCDGVMLDIKSVDQKYHEILTGCSNENALKSLDYLLEKAKLYEVRTVLLPGQLALNKATISYVVAKLNNRCRYKLIKYRPQGVREAGLQAYGNQSLNEAEFSELVAFAKSLKAENLVLI